MHVVCIALRQASVLFLMLICIMSQYLINVCNTGIGKTGMHEM